MNFDELVCTSSTDTLLLFNSGGDIDTSGIHALEELFRTLEKRKIQVRHETWCYNSSTDPLAEHLTKKKFLVPAIYS